MSAPLASGSGSGLLLYSEVERRDFRHEARVKFLDAAGILPAQLSSFSKPSTGRSPSASAPTGPLHVLARGKRSGRSGAPEYFELNQDATYKVVPKRNARACCPSPSGGNMQNDMMSAIRAVVADEVSKTLGRQVELLEQIAQYLGVASSQAPAATPKRAQAEVAAPKSQAPAPRKRGNARRTPREEMPASASEPSAAPFKEGQKVSYKQGRGTFPSVVKFVNEKKGTVMVERISDGKQVERPFDKVETA